MIWISYRPKWEELDRLADERVSPIGGEKRGHFCHGFVDHSNHAVHAYIPARSATGRSPAGSRNPSSLFQPPGSDPATSFSLFLWNLLFAPATSSTRNDSARGEFQLMIICCCAHRENPRRSLEPIKYWCIIGHSICRQIRNGQSGGGN